MRKRKDNFTVSPDTGLDNSTNNLTDKSVENAQILIEGTISVDDILEIIKKCEHQLEQLHSATSTINAQNQHKIEEINELKAQILDIDVKRMGKLRFMLQQTDTNLYNQFLNGEYLSAKKQNDKFAKTKLLSEDVLSFPSNANIRALIAEYRSKLNNQIIVYDGQVNTIKQAIENMELSIKRNNDKLKEIQQQIAFYQTRILRLERVLVS
ncbi:hypothetical protein KDU71_06100 [Carboxylicivirga sediminis]|uniref:Uncharacterized protein n=1 Tax=Carboxylicivirga sediminis TaxID=2006564 RepID=A0A941IXU6_9BACT|nr:hypothetical protein [Carboxylicivirga sediminis]MBR8535122.1 hypothetical protein [Carboxylicivirga sediminis]